MLSKLISKLRIRLKSLTPIAEEEETHRRQESQQGERVGLVADGGVPEASAASRTQPLRWQGTRAGPALQGEVPRG